MRGKDPLAAVHPTLRRGLSPLIRWLAGHKLTPRWIGGLFWVGRAIQVMAGIGTPSQSVTVKDAPDVKVWLIDRRKTTDTPTPAVLHIHGGGFVSGMPALMFGMLKKLSAELDCLVVTVDYRLAPWTKFPGALEDNHAALGWLHANASALNIDVRRIAVMGDSAGGGHAAMLAIAARDRAEFAPLLFQLLIYPMLDDRTGSTRPTSSPLMGAQMWTAAHNIFGWASLLGLPAGCEAPPYGSVPARVADLSGLPPAWIGVGTLDLFHDEDIAYARRLQEAGVPVTLEVVEGAYHGFDGLVPEAPSSMAFTASWKAALRHAFDNKEARS